MDEIKHYWDSIKCITKYDNEAVNYLQMYFVQCSKRKSHIELPKRNFGSSSMCSYCGILWSKKQPQVRIVPGRSPSKSVKKIVEASKEGIKLSKFQASLMKKCLKNSKNTIVMKCAVCSYKTKISSSKPKKIKIKKEETIDTPMRKKKKKKKKDKTAGLNISFLSTPKVKTKKQIEPSPFTPVTVEIKKPKINDSTKKVEVKKLNKKKLNNVLNSSKSQKSRNSLSNFLKELY